MKINHHKHIKKELDELESSLTQSINSDIPLATQVSSYIVKSGGKRIRPTINILIAKALGYRGNKLINLATAIELFHTASLIHDDVVDQSDIRRGITSIHKKWGNAHGVLVGDFVYSKAFQLIASLNNKEIIQSLADSTNKISEGEILQLNLQNAKRIHEKDYFEIIERKTAELFKASAHSAALLTNAKKPLIKASSKFASSLGIAFQLKDDLLDYIGNQKETGKIIGKDYQEGKLTLPLIKAFELSNKEDFLFIERAFEARDPKRLKKVIKIICESGATKEVQKISKKISSKCLEHLDKFPETPYKESLRGIVLSINTRTK